MVPFSNKMSRPVSGFRKLWGCRKINEGVQEEEAYIKLLQPTLTAQNNLLAQDPVATCFSECEGKHVVGASIFGEKINFEGECDLDSFFEAKFSHSPLTYSYTPLIGNFNFFFHFLILSP